MSSYFDEASLVMIPSGYKDQKVYSIKPLDGAGDLVASRASSATRVASNGLIEKVRTNLALYSEQFNDASWLKGTLTVSANAGTAPNGTTTADLIYPSSSTGNCVIYNGITITSGLEYTNSVYAKASGKTWTFIRGINDGVGAWFNLSTGVVGAVQSGVTATITSIGSGWYRCSVTQTSTSTTGRLVILVVDGDGSTAVTANGTDGLLIWGGQQETGVMTDYIATTSAAVSVGPVSGVPRLDYLNSTCPRLLLEPQRTNLQTNSENGTGTNWGNTLRVNVTANQVASPDGYVNADSVADTTANNTHWFETSFSATSGTAYTLSFFAKANTLSQVTIYGFSDNAVFSGQQAFFNVSNGTVVSNTGGGTANVVNYGNGWYRVSLTLTAGATATGYLAFGLAKNGSSSYTGNGSSLYMWGIQLEAGAYATSYIPTLGTSVTRVADAALTGSVPSLIGQTAGTIFWQGSVDYRQSGDGHALALSGSASSFGDAMLLYRQSSNGHLAIYIQIGGANQFGTPLTYNDTASVSENDKYAIAYANNDLVVYKNGVQIISASSGSIPACNYFLLNEWNNTYVNTNITKQAILFPTRLSNSDLAALTA